MNYMYASLLLLVTFSATAAGLPCSIQPPKGTPDSALAGMAKVTEADAQKTALRGFADFASPASIAASELESEDGCLIYSFDIRVAGAKGIDEVAIDAGTGKVLSRKHETAEQEADEAKEDAAAAKASAAKSKSSQ